MLILANWKLNKTNPEVVVWLSEFTDLLTHRFTDLPEIAIAPTFPYLEALLSPKGLRRFYEAAAQDVSKFPHASAHTGEVSANQLADLGVRYVIVGHSERRQGFGETMEDVNEKIKRCIENDLLPVVCVSNLDQIRSLVPLRQDCGGRLPAVAAYEPLEAIGSGNPKSPENVQRMALAIKKVLGDNTRVLYGGSVDSQNVINYTDLSKIDGVLVGTASLAAKEFVKLLRAVVAK